MDHRALWLAAVAAWPGAALAQQPPPTPAPAQKPPAGTVQGVTVTGQAPPIRTDIDRRSYSVAGDLQATTGSVADALRNIPSVEVDVQGNVSLRGDPNVTIMIDGRPSALFRGEGRAQALQALPADQIERVEVLTNPSAAINPEGAAGVINLVTKKNRRLGNSGSVRANVGSDARWNVGVSGARNDGKLTLAGDLTYRRDTQKFDVEDRRARLDASSGEFLEYRQKSVGSNRIDMVFGRAALDYDPDDRTRVTLEANYHGIRPETAAYDHLEYDAPGGGPGGGLGRVFDRINGQDQSRDNLGLSASYRRKFPGEGHELVVDLDHEIGEVDRTRRTTTLYRLPPAPDLLEEIGYDNSTRKTELKADYTRPLPGEAKLKAGYSLQVDDNSYGQAGRRGAATPLPLDPRLTYRFLYDQTINTAYATYQRPVGDVTVLAGLRVEDVRLDLDLTTGGPVHAENDYFRAYPSLHLSYEVAQGRQLTASYSRRIQRPTPDDLNPFVIEIDPLTFKAGNPNLKPQETDSFELGYQHRKDGTVLLATLYYRRSSKGVTDVVRDLGNDAYLTTRENLRDSRSGGLELVANGKLDPKLSYNLSGNVFWNEIDASSLGFPGKRDGYTLTGRANLNWQPTPRDFVQINGFVGGKRLTAQGYAKSFSILNLGYRHKFTDSLSGVVTAQDVLGTFRDTQVLDTTTLQGRTRREFSVRGAYLGLTWTFGRQRPRDPGFDFGQGGPPAS